MTALPELLTVEEAARKLRRSAYHVRYLLRTGKIKGKKLAPNGPWLIPVTEMHAALSGVAVGVEPQTEPKNEDKTAA